jgi:hypothetical protein
VLKRTRLKEIAFIEDFYKRAEDYLVTFLRADEANENSRDRYSHKRLPDNEMEALAKSLANQREELSKLVDEATQLSKK